MSTIPSRLSRVARPSINSSESRSRVLQLYRDWYRSAPEICTLYALNHSPTYIRHSLRLKFEKNRYVTDQRAIDILIHKSRLELQETMNVWKQNDHVLGILLAHSEEEGPKTFLQKFYEGRDEEAVAPAASGVH
ncbi:NdufA6 NADH-ubiquinone oxidoreductase subunit [Agaricus bisporus var. bisporus H97]|uniref:NdufA6 NADH-ubiquinone oxidoreductase subunit n=1 Tax=Agaricus bisporus var. bisporus (strain H97 / ATCC MYA-4626 / FGSC 10389) TaxID=936046 RepID=UPI00029F7011|nr:NdufA6 NADH-ubiquinone oxidoreductase subunit [Agaricus bisporus var. bisporus H97]EKV43485.1 NdufA6 NADH-ubiquinone oxidoreductase subunit [Agaricus bisporus var. bisporus H97]